MTRPYAERRALLENLFSELSLTAPWTLCPMTTDLAKAREWLESWTDVSGIEGILIKSMSQRYLPGYRGWTKIRRRDTTEAIIGAITGTLTRPQLLVLGRHDHDGRLRAVGRTVPLRPDVARQVAEHLTAAAPGHPWTGAKFSAAWGSRDVLDTTLVHPAPYGHRRPRGGGRGTHDAPAVRHPASFWALAESSWRVARDFFPVSEGCRVVMHLQDCRASFTLTDRSSACPKARGRGAGGRAERTSPARSVTTPMGAWMTRQPLLQFTVPELVGGACKAHQPSRARPIQRPRRGPARRTVSGTRVARGGPQPRPHPVRRRLGGGRRRHGARGGHCEHGDEQACRWIACGMPSTTSASSRPWPGRTAVTPGCAVTSSPCTPPPAPSKPAGGSPRYRPWTAPRAAVRLPGRRRRRPAVRSRPRPLGSPRMHRPDRSGVRSFHAASFG
ncbi:hypothetical protein [Streptomyces sp. NPDC056544]|uniref:ATP-dependent DNA ligase n=1 Tax=Streptomyces sp. NPDC056544 TaxID=3345863 RepID=UPI0036BF8577